jgi:ribosomal protein S18 acetylase RimI-like enzyme
MNIGGLTRLTYFKRFKMELSLGDLPTPPCLPPGCSLVPWHPDLLETHAEVLAASFQNEIDATVFSSLADLPGCRGLMLAIVRRRGFLPESTWLLQGPDGPWGSVQGVREPSGIGALQNLGVIPARRGRGGGEALLYQSLCGFRAAGLGRAMLEVTAQNDGAVRLYRRCGFRRARVVYKVVPDQGVL